MPIAFYIKNLTTFQQIILLSILYFLAARIGSILALPPGYVSPIWPAAGLAVAALLVWGSKCWPGIFLGSMSFNLSVAPDLGQTPSILVAILIAMGSTLQSLFAKWLIESFTSPPWQFDTAQQVLAVSLLGGPAACILATSVGNLALFWFDFIQTNQLPVSLLAWWIGDSIGIILFTPLLLILLDPDNRVSRQRKFWIFTPYMGLFVFIISLLIVTQNYETSRMGDALAQRTTIISQFVKGRLTENLHTLNAIRRFFYASEQVNETEFQQFLGSNHTPSGANEPILWVPAVTYQDYDAFARYATKSAGLQLPAPLPSNFQRIIEIAPYYYPIMYSTLGDHSPSLSIDHLSTNHQFLSAIREAAHQDDPVLRLIDLNSSPQAKLGSTLISLLKINKPNLEYDRYSLLISFISLELLSRDIRLQEAADNTAILIRDAEEKKPLIWIEADPPSHSTTDGFPDNLDNNDLTRATTIAMGGLSLEILLIPNQQFITEHSTWYLWIVLASALLISSLAGNLLMLVTGYRESIERTVSERTAQLTELNKTIQIERRELKERQAFLDSLIDNLPMALCVKEAYQLSFVRLNQASEKLLGRSEEDLVGCDAFDIFPRAKAEEVSKSDREALRLKQVIHISNEQIETPAGPRTLSTHKIPINDADGNPHYLLCVSEDITQHIEAEQRFERLFEAAPFGLILVDEDGNIVHSNRMFEQIFDYSAVEANSLNIDCLIPEAQGPGHHQKMLQFFRNPSTRYLGKERVLNGVTKAGTIIPLDIALNPITYNNRQHVLVGIMDISERIQLSKALSKEQKRFQLILEAAGEGIYGVDNQGIATFFNKAGATMLGYQPEELIGTSIHQVIHHSRPDGSPYPEEECSMALKPGNQLTRSDSREILWNKEGAPLPVEYTCTPLIDENNQTIGSVIIFKDISQRLEQEKKLKQKNQELGLANRHKTEFLANASHELRTPLNSIIGFTNILLDKSADKLTDRELNALETVNQNGLHLLKLINEILDLAKIEAGKQDIEIEEFDLVELIADTRLPTEQALEGKPVSFDISIDRPSLVMRSDRHKLQQILNNLLSNAIKYTEQGTIEVSVSAQQDLAVIAVSDTGIGIAEKDQPMLFKEFVRSREAKTRRISGTGLGLAITTQLVSMLQGNINVNSKPGQGSVFTVTLPLQYTAFS